MTIIMSYYASLIPVNFFTYASLFSVTALLASHAGVFRGARPRWGGKKYELP